DAKRSIVCLTENRLAIVINPSPLILAPLPGIVLEAKQTAIFQLCRPTLFAKKPALYLDCIFYIYTCVFACRQWAASRHLADRIAAMRVRFNRLLAPMRTIQSGTNPHAEDLQKRGTGRVRRSATSRLATAFLPWMALTVIAVTAAAG